MFGFKMNFLFPDVETLSLYVFVVLLRSQIFIIDFYCCFVHALYCCYVLFCTELNFSCY